MALLAADPPGNSGPPSPADLLAPASRDILADLVDRFALHDKTGLELGAVPH